MSRLSFALACAALALPLAPAGPQPAVPTVPKPRLDLYGDPLPAGAVARLGSLRFRAESYAVSPDGTLLAKVYGANMAAICDRNTGRILHHLATAQETSDPPSSMLVHGFSPDGRKLAIRITRGPYQMFDVASGKLLWQTRQLSDAVESLFTSDSTAVLVRGRNDEIRELDANTGRLRQSYRRPPGKYVEIYPLRNGRLVAAGYEKDALCLWDVWANRVLRRIKVDHVRDLRMLLSPAGDALVASDQERGSVFLWDLAAEKEPLQIQAKNSYFPLRFSPDGKTLAIAHDDAPDMLLELRDVRTGRRGAAIRAGAPLEADSPESVSDFEFSPDGRLLAFVADQYFSLSLRLWDVETRKEVGRWPVAAGPPTSLSFSASGNLMVLREGEALRFWDVATRRELPVPGGHSGEAYELRFSDDGRKLVSGGQDGRIIVWETATARVLHTLDGIRDRHTTFAVAPAGTNRLAAFDGFGLNKVLLWDFDAGAQPRRLNHESDFEGGLVNMQHPPSYVEFSPDGTTLTAGAWLCRPVARYDAATGKQLSPLPTPKQFDGFAYSPDGKTLAISSFKRTIELRDVATGKTRQTISADDEEKFYYQSPFFSPDGRLLGAARDSKVRLWEVASGKPLVPDPPKPGGLTMDHVGMVGIMPDGRILAFGDDRRSFWLDDVIAGDMIYRFPEELGIVSDDAFSPDGHWFACALYDTSILIWDLREIAPNPRVGLRLGEAELSGLWNDLAGRDVRRAYSAQLTLAANPARAVEFLKGKLEPAKAADLDSLRGWIDDLSSDRFKVREEATRRLSALGGLASPALRQALAKKPPPEVRARIERLLDQLEGPLTDPELLRHVRAVAALEYAGTADALKVIDALSKGTPGSRLTIEANGSRERLSKRLSRAAAK